MFAHNQPAPSSQQNSTTTGTIAIAIVAFAAALAANPAAAQVQINPDGAIQVPAFSLPVSSIFDEKTRKELSAYHETAMKRIASTAKCPNQETADLGTIAQARQCARDSFYGSEMYKEFRALYPVDIRDETMGGVRTQIFTPKDGVSKKNQDRVLINVHGGHFKIGSGTISHGEAIPIASLGKYKVVSVDYRMAPEASFPAASEDVAAVYRVLLKTYKPQNIGIYGCSAGGLLTAQSIAWLLKEKLPLPGAASMSGAAAAYYQEGDSGQLSQAMGRRPLEMPDKHPYFKSTNAMDPLAFPIRSDAVMAKFPPSLLIASTRDIGMSAVIYTHQTLLRLGVPAELRIWEGVDHCFPFALTHPMGPEADKAIAQFFDRNLGRAR